MNLYHYPFWFDALVTFDGGTMAIKVCFSPVSALNGGFGWTEVSAHPGGKLDGVHCQGHQSMGMTMAITRDPAKMPIMGSQESHKTSKPSSPCEDRLLVKGACLTLPLNPMMNHPFSPWKKVFLEAEWDCSGTSQWSACLCPVQVRGPRILKRWSYFSIGTYLFYIHIYFYWHLGQSFRTGHYLGINLPVDSGSWLDRLDPYAFHQDGLRTFVKDTVCVLYYYYIQYIYIYFHSTAESLHIYILHQILYII